MAFTDTPQYRCTKTIEKGNATFEVGKVYPNRIGSDTDVILDKGSDGGVVKFTAEEIEDHFILVKP